MRYKQPYAQIKGEEREKISGNIFANINYICEIKKISAEKISKEVGMRRNYLNETKRRKAIPNEGVVKKICDKFSLTENALLYNDLRAEYENLINKNVEPVKKIIHKTPDMKIPRLEKKEKKVFTTETHVVHDDIDTNVEIITLLMNMSKKYKLKINANHENGNIVIDCGKQIADFFYINSGINRA